MNWITFTKDEPDLLHCHLESAEDGLPYIVPNVVMESTNDASRLGYVDVGKRFSVDWHVVDAGSIQQTVADILCLTRHNGTLEPMLLLTTDSMVFLDRVGLSTVWNVLKDRKILGVSLTLDAKREGPPLTELHFVHNEADVYCWQWRGCEGAWGAPQAFGVIYRTSDILGPLSRLEWNDPESLQKAVSGDASLRSKERMACFAQATILDISDE